MLLIHSHPLIIYSLVILSYLEAKGIKATSLNHNRKATHRHWDAYIEAMKGHLTSIPADIHKLDAKFARQRSEARFFQSRNQNSANRSAFHLTKMLKRQAG